MRDDAVDGDPVSLCHTRVLLEGDLDEVNLDGRPTRFRKEHMV